MIKMGKILIISFGHPPDVSGSAINIQMLAKELAKNNDVTVVVTNWNQLKNGDNYYKAETYKIMCLEHNRFFITLYSIVKKSSIMLKSSILHYVSEFIMAIANYSVIKLIKNGKVDRVITLCYPFANHIIGSRIKKLFGIQWFAYYLDPGFADDVNYNRKKRRLANVVERRILNNADKIIMLKWLYEIYKEKDYPFSYKTEYINLPISLTQINRNNNQGKELCFVYVGTLYRGLREPGGMFDFFAEIYNKLEIPIKLIVIGKMNGYSKYDVNSWEKRYPFFTYCGVVKPNDVINYYNMADFLVSIGNMNIFQMPSKVFDYMGTGLPIIHFSSIPNCPVEGVLSDYPLALCVPNDDRKIDFDFYISRIKEYVKKRVDIENNLFLARYSIHNIARVFEDNR